MAKSRRAFGLEDWLIAIAIVLLLFTPLIGGNWWWLLIVGAVIILAFILINRQKPLVNV